MTRFSLSPAGVLWSTYLGGLIILLVWMSL